MIGGCPWITARMPSTSSPPPPASSGTARMRARRRPTTGLASPHTSTVKPSPTGMTPAKGACSICTRYMTTKPTPPTQMAAATNLARPRSQVVVFRNQATTPSPSASAMVAAARNGFGCSEPMAERRAGQKNRSTGITMTEPLREREAPGEKWLHGPNCSRISEIIERKFDV